MNKKNYLSASISSSNKQNSHGKSFSLFPKPQKGKDANEPIS